MTKTDGKRSRHPWRENVEALSMAVVVALLFKSFILEISKIPSGSMQPTLMGNPETQVFDRVLVDKLSMHFRDPERWEIVVFKHPIERSRIMVKRLVGMPGEELRIAEGDLWTREDPEGPWRVLRRPPRVQAEMWRRLDPKDPSRSSWSVVEGGQDWRLDGRDVTARGAGRVQFWADRGAVRDGYLDGYPDSLRPRISIRTPDWGRNAVSDLRLEGEVEALEGTQAIVAELTEGSRRYTFRLPGPAAAEGSAPTIEVNDPRRPTNGDAPEGEIRAEPWRLRAGDEVDFAVENLDDRLALYVDGELVLEREIPPAERREATLTLTVEGEGADLEDLQVYRDVFYLPHRGPTWDVRIPGGHYVMLGDNTQDSADSRDWEFVRFRWPDAPTEDGLRGNFRKGGENPSWGESAEGAALTRFRDEWGEQHWFEREAGRQGFQVPAPLVSRELIQGRAVAVFWPIKPHRKLVRLAWLH